MTAWRVEAIVLSALMLRNATSPHILSPTSSTHATQTVNDPQPTACALNEKAIAKGPPASGREASS